MSKTPTASEVWLDFQDNSPLLSRMGAEFRKEAHQALTVKNKATKAAAVSKWKDYKGYFDRIVPPMRKAYNDNPKASWRGDARVLLDGVDADLRTNRGLYDKLS